MCTQQFVSVKRQHFKFSVLDDPEMRTVEIGRKMSTEVSCLSQILRQHHIHSFLSVNTMHKYLQWTRVLLKDLIKMSEQTVTSTEKYIIKSK